MTITELIKTHFTYEYNPNQISPTEPIPVYTCTHCDEGIYEGSKYIIKDNKNVCYNCVAELYKDASDFLEYFGYGFTLSEVLFNFKIETEIAGEDENE